MLTSLHGQQRLPPIVLHVLGSFIANTQYMISPMRSLSGAVPVLFTHLWLRA